MLLRDSLIVDRTMPVDNCIIFNGNAFADLSPSHTNTTLQKGRICAFSMIDMQNTMLFAGGIYAMAA